MAKRILTVMAVSLAAVALVAGGALFWLVVIDPGKAIQQEQIEKILAVESPVYYHDGRTTIGVFFQQDHRQYVPYDKIPKAFVNAIVAAEDHDFFHHHGVDFPGIIRAMLANLKAGRVVQGGSTITQQTAKNLFKRKDRSLTAKLKELLYAWRLEYHYPKEKILEFYANQFYVSGNGRGLGVAARYYFDKPVEDLDVLECAFIAGSVKRPNYYNPFNKRDQQAAEAARKRARERVAYVLGQMYRLGMLSAAQYQQQLAREIPFRRGKMSYSLNTIMDLVKEGLAEPAVEEALSRHGIDNVATSGIRIVTTVERDLQEAALYSLRKELSRLDVRLRGYDQQALQKVYQELPFGDPQELRRTGFLVGRIVAVDRGDQPGVSVSFSRDQTPQGRIDRAGLLNLATPLARYQRQRWSEAGAHDLAGLLATLKKGELVLVSIRGQDSLSGQYLLDLEKYPQLQGAVLAFKDGTIRAMVGGMDNRYFNRAIMARRPVGSVMKPLVYCAALQLGWSPLDLLNNQRNVFVYQNRPYFPRPDHASPHARVSMSWAGVHSENLASVWLLYHLTDHLAPARFAEVADHLGLGRQGGESYQHYQHRIRDQLGVVVDRDALLQAAFARAVTLVEPDLLFDGRLAEYEALKTLPYGADFDRFLAELDQQEKEAGTDPGKAEQAEIALRRRLLKRHFLRFLGLYRDLRRLAAQQARGGLLLQPTRLYREQGGDRYQYAEEPPATGWRYVSEEELGRLLGGMTPPQRRQFWERVLIAGELGAGIVGQLEKATAAEYARLAELPPYSPEVLHRIRDFKVLVGLHYLTGMCRAMGITSPLEPVLSFPLGSNVITLLEVARAYEGIKSGYRFLRGGQESGGGLAIIARIENSDGEVIYRPAESSSRVLDPKVSLSVTDILRNVVRFGTARLAGERVRLHSRDPGREAQLAALDLRVPLFGKTGTANRFTNAAFAGFVPGPGKGNSLSLEGGYVLASYVGFDDNAPMVRSSTHITGAAGALPVWIDLANSLLESRDYAGRLDLADLTFAGVSEVPLALPQLGQVEIPVDAGSGGMVSNGQVDGQAAVLAFGALSQGGEFVPARFYQPYWEAWEK